MSLTSPALASGFSLPSSRGFSRPRNRARVACIAGRFFTSLASREALKRFPLWGVLHTSAFSSLGQRRRPETSVKGTRALQRSPRRHEVPPSPGATSSEGAPSLGREPRSCWLLSRRPVPPRGQRRAARPWGESAPWRRLAYRLRPSFSTGSGGGERPGGTGVPGSREPRGQSRDGAPGNSGRG